MRCRPVAPVSLWTTLELRARKVHHVLVRVGNDSVGDPRSGQASSPTRPASPPAQRAPGPRWRDPRLVVGLLIVAVSVLAGARILAAADDTVAVWAARVDLPAGSEVTPADLERQQVRFTSSDLAGRYLSAREPAPSGTVLAREVAAGELLPRAALSVGSEEDHVEVPLAAAADAVPATLRPGEVVDVWVTPPDPEGRTEAVLVLEEVRVVAAPRDSGGLGPASTRQVVVSVPEDAETGLAAALARLSSGTVVLVRRG